MHELANMAATKAQKMNAHHDESSPNSNFKVILVLVLFG